MKESYKKETTWEDVIDFIVGALFLFSLFISIFFVNITAGLVIIPFIIGIMGLYIVMRLSFDIGS